ncbi:complement factor H-related protein 1-like isoform X2 [Pantherophis guttatus]|uniref:Complement factor H-related protein 1-like isoform X2 n=1 Tax=Pantherophis guttatus TaxID=94885 RepID=A0ABM3ZCG8_PANGU|nr:complement factor H-related protein 1-like isoform X2 [Pantherophis guttatus]
MKSCFLLVAAFLLWPSFSSQNVCEEPDEIDFGEIVTTEKVKYLENDRVQYRCNPGYVLEGPEWIQCKEQEWTPHPPKCLAPCRITRQQLAAKKLFAFGGQRKTQFIQSNHSLQFQCNEGYVLVAPSVRKCVDSYMELPLCISERGQNCSGPPRTENGDISTLSEKQYRSGSSVEFRCQKYYAMEGQNRSFCDNGTWTKVPICLDPCMIPKAELERQKIEVKDGMDASENTFVQRGHSIELTCKTGYVLAANASQSASVIHCNGTPPVIPNCKEITCNSPRVLNGSFRPIKNIYHDGDLIRIQCDSGFILETDYGGKVVECTENGWSPSPKCVFEITCQADYIEHGTILSPKVIYKEGERIRFSCNEGYTYVDRPDALCTETGWSTILQCTEIQCPPPQMRNGLFRPYRSQYMYNDAIEIWCSPMSNFGNKFSKCTANGWSPPPLC